MRRLFAALSVASIVVLAFVQSALATNYDLSPAADGIQSQVTDVLTVVLPIAGGIVALFLGWKVLRRFIGAR